MRQIDCSGSRGDSNRATTPDSGSPIRGAGSTGGVLQPCDARQQPTPTSADASSRMHQARPPEKPPDPPKIEPVKPTRNTAVGCMR